MENLNKTGARKGRANAFREWISKVAAPVLVVFPVPGESYFRSRGIYLHDHFDVAANPREANVLLVGGAVSKKMAQKIAVVYLQIPRPRALVFAGTENVSILSDPDFQVDLNDEEIRNLKTNLTKKFRNTYRDDATAFQPEFIKEMMEEDDDDGGHDHHHGHQHGGNGEKKKPMNMQNTNIMMRTNTKNSIRTKEIMKAINTRNTASTNINTKDMNRVVTIIATTIMEVMTMEATTTAAWDLCRWWK